MFNKENKKRTAEELAQYFNSLSSNPDAEFNSRIKDGVEVIPVFIGRDVNCPPMRIWEASYSDHDPISSVRESLEKHILECEYCRKMHKDMVEAIKTRESESCNDSNCRHHSK